MAAIMAEVFWETRHNEPEGGWERVGSSCGVRREGRWHGARLGDKGGIPIVNTSNSQ